MNGVMQAAGPAAQVIANIGWLLFGGGMVIFVGVMLLLAWAVRGRAKGLKAKAWILGGGVVLPSLVLGALFAYALPLSPAWRPVPPPGALVVSVTAHMWWWEVRYAGVDGTGEVVTANEIHIPTGRPVYLALASGDVIHSFWVPALAGKMDMVPGRMQHLLLSAARPGIYRGQCAEFCGEQHARMALHVVAQEPAAFDAWLQAQARPAVSRSLRGEQAFLQQRCNACHAVRGATGDARLAPDLTHVGSRLHIAAGTLPNSSASLAHWIAHVQEVKAGARMASYPQIDPDTLAAMALWLESLK